MSLIIRILRKEDPLDRINLWSLKTDTMRETINHTILKYWFPVVLWVGFTILMSTGTFSEENTSRIIEPVVKFFVPAISTHELGILTAEGARRIVEEVRREIEDAIKFKFLTQPLSPAELEKLIDLRYVP